MVTASSDSILWPVSGSNRVMRSIWSPKNSTRKASSRPAGQSSTVSPRTRNWPRVNSMSLRVYCRSTSRCRKWSRPISRPAADRDDHRLVILLAADAVDARDAGHHDHVPAREQAAHGREPQPLDLVVDARILLDEGVGARDVGLGLVVIEVADEVFDRVVREEALELGVKLRGQRLVMRDDQRGPVHVPDDVGDGEGLARAGDAQQHLVLRAGQQPFRQLRNRLRLVPGRLVRRDEFEHQKPSYERAAAESTRRAKRPFGGIESGSSHWTRAGTGAMSNSELIWS